MRLASSGVVVESPIGVAVREYSVVARENSDMVWEVSVVVRESSDMLGVGLRRKRSAMGRGIMLFGRAGTGGTA